MTFETQRFRKISSLGWLLTACFIAMTFVPRSLDNYMFVDGLAYASIARNMAEGAGSFWRPYFADSFWLTYNHSCGFFCEHPPLMFGMQAALFRLLGDSTLVENLYNLLVLLASLFLISGIWRMLFRDHAGFRIQTWLPVLMWYGLRVVWWSMPNNLLDSTMAVFCLAAVHLQLKAFHSSRPAGYLLLSATMVVCAAMTKGPVGLYPVAFPLIYGLVYERDNLITALLRSVSVFAISALLIGGILLYPPAWFLLSNYFEGQIIAALSGQRERVREDWTAHFYLLRLLLTNILPHLAVVGGLLLLRKPRKIKDLVPPHARYAATLAAITTGLILLPMLASVKQGDYYLMPALPFVGLCFGAVAVQLVQVTFERFPGHFQSVVAAVSVALLSVMVYKSTHPESDRIAEISTELTRVVPPRSKVFLPPAVSMYAQIQTPFQRYAKLSIAFDPAQTRYLYFDFLDQKALDTLQKHGAFRLVHLSHGAAVAVRDSLPGPLKSRSAQLR